MPHQGEHHRRIAGRFRPAGALIHGTRAGKKPVDIDALQRRRHQTDHAHHTGPATDPIGHRETFDPAFRHRHFVQLAPHARDRHRVSGKRQPGCFVSRPDFEHPVACLWSAAGFGGHHHQRLRQTTRPNLPEHPCRSHPDRCCRGTTFLKPAGWPTHPPPAAGRAPIRRCRHRGAGETGPLSEESPRRDESWPRTPWRLRGPR